MRVVWWGTYDTTKPRTRILMEGLAAAGVEIVEIHAPIWNDVRDKSALGTGFSSVLRLVRWLAAYPPLIARYLAAPDHDAVIVGYLGQIDVIVLRPFAWLRGKPVLWDAFISLYNTIVEDRGMLQRSRLVANAVKALEAAACRCADRVLLDTAAHASYFARTYGLPDQRLGSVFVGAERIFVDAGQKPRPQVPRKRPRILFYGQFIPLHGIDVIVDAAASERGRAYDWILVGEGQEAERIDRRLQELALSHVQRVQWIPYEQLVAAISDADVSLGIFSENIKAGMVIPNKVFQVLAVGQKLVTRDSPAIRELVDPRSTNVALVEPGSPKALLEGLERVLLGSSGSGVATEIRERITPEAVGRSLKAEIEWMIGNYRGTRKTRLGNASEGPTPSADSQA